MGTLSKMLGIFKILAKAVIILFTFQALGSQILEKPNDKKHAYQMLRSLSGRNHTVHTGVILLTRYHSQGKMGFL